MCGIITVLERSNSVDERTDPQVLLQVITIQLIKEKNCKQSQFCKTVSKAFEIELDLLKMINTIHLYIICTINEKASFHFLYFIPKLTCLCDWSSREILFVIKSIVLSFVLLVKYLLFIDMFWA